MHVVHRYAAVIYPAIWLIGLGFLFATTTSWWPGVLFLAGASAMVYGLTGNPGGYRAMQGGVLAIGLGVCDLLHYNLGMVFVVLGVCVLIAFLLKPTDPDSKPPMDPLGPTLD